MHISIHLHGILRDILPPGTRGRATLDLPASATVADLLTQLNIQRGVLVSVNGHPNLEAGHVLQDGDQVVVYTPVGGG
jgi:sulfur carrier protein ThiS